MSNNPKPEKSSKPDGRRMRSERSRTAIVEAMLNLIDEGNLSPTAQQTAERAGVGMRSVFRHFEDMESIFSQADDLVQPRIDEIFRNVDRAGSLSERILHAAELHARVFEKTKHLSLSTTARSWRSKTLRKNYARSQRKLRKDLEIWLPELNDLNKIRREAVDAIASFENWHRLREHQDLSRKDSTKVVVEMLELLILEKT